MTAALRVLYVDDEPALLDLCKMFLERSEDLTVTTATGAPEAIRILGQERFDTIVSDYQMPEMNGIEFLKHLKAEGNTMPFIIFTGKGSEEIAIEAFENGADFYLQKGGEPKTQFAELAHKILRAVQHRIDEKAFQESEERFRHISDLITDFAYSCKKAPSGGFAIDWITDAVETITGYTSDEIRAMNCWKFLVIDEDIPVFEKNVTGLTPGESVRCELQIRRKDSGIIWLVSFAKCVTDPKEPGYHRLYGGCRDITVHKQADEAVRVAHEKYTKAFLSAPDAIIISDLGTGRFIEMNDATSQIYGYSRDEMIGKSALELGIWLREEDRDAFINQVRTQGRVERYELVERRKSGDLFNASVYSEIITIGDKPHLLSIIRDITDRKRAEEALRQVNKQLNLLSSITRHDILNQVMLLKGYIELSREYLGDNNLLGDFLDEEDKAARTIEHQITFTRDYQELGITAPAWQNINECIRNAMEALPMRVVHVEPDPADPEVYSDFLFAKVFYNLIDNALKYGGDQMKTIRITSQESDRGLILVCEDDGVGISAEDKKHLFTRSFGKNSGLGLFLSREILSITGITITENGSPGKGARFEITVPKGIYRFVKKER